MNLKNLNHNKLVDLWLTSQGDMTLIPGDKKRNTDKKLCNNCWSELIRRANMKQNKKKNNSQIKGANLLLRKIKLWENN